MNKHTLRLATILLAATCLAGLTGCAVEPEGNATGQTIREAPSYRDQDLEYKAVELPDGRDIECIIFSASKKGGLSCDWQHPVNGKETK